LINLKKTQHYKSERRTREEFIRDEIGYGDVIETFCRDCSHSDGPENHVITSTGIILIYNAITNRLVTTLIACPQQIKRYYEREGREAPPELVALAKEHQEKGYNNR
jgi:hypothetical protein